MSDSQEKTFGELLSEGIGKMKTDLAAALAANQRLEKERDEANAFIRLQESEFQDKWKCLSAERDRLMADVVQYRRVLEKIAPKCEHCRNIATFKEAFTEGYYLCAEHATAEYHDRVTHPATVALATEHPGAPLVEAVGKAYEALKHSAATFASYVKIHADKHTPEGDAKAIANHLAHTECMEALALLAPNENQ